MFVDATAAARAALGDAIGANMFMLGYAYQAGLVPLTSASIRRAIELNGEAVPMNLAAFAWGRAAFADPKALEALAAPVQKSAPDDLAAIVEKRFAFLTAYQDRAYAERYRALVDEVAKAEGSGRTGLALAVARYAFKVMAYKDEYEVARLFTDGAFAKAIGKAFEGDLKLTYHLAPPLLGRKDPRTGLPVKTAFGPWMGRAFGVLAGLKGLRGGMFDVFGYSQERRDERRLVEDYFALVREIVAKLDARNHGLAVTLASLPEKVRGYGHVKAKSLEAVRADWAKGLETWRGGAPLARAAE